MRSGQSELSDFISLMIEGLSLRLCLMLSSLLLLILPRFVRWRAAIMELSVKQLDLPSATEKIPVDGLDPYRMIQVHDYLNISFLRMDPNIKAASKETIQIFSMAYPELLRASYRSIPTSSDIEISFGIRWR